MTDAQAIIDYYYPATCRLRYILMTHSRLVAEKAVEVCERHPELGLDIDFVRAAALLHDIGITRCDAPSIACHGTEPYLRHGLCGGEMLREYAAVHGIAAENMEPYARICERHTGTGLTARQIIAEHLPLPHCDLTPETVAEQVICYADKFFSKTRLEREKTYDEALHSLRKFGEAGLAVFAAWHSRFA